MKNFEDYDLVNECMNKYLDSMPIRSKVTFPHLVASVKDMMKAYPPMTATDTHIASIARVVVSARTDLVVMRGIGIYKHERLVPGSTLW